MHQQLKQIWVVISDIESCSSLSENCPKTTLVDKPGASSTVPVGLELSSISVHNSWSYSCLLFLLSTLVISGHLLLLVHSSIIPFSVGRAGDSLPISIHIEIVSNPLLR